MYWYCSFSTSKPELNLGVLYTRCWIVCVSTSRCSAATFLSFSLTVLTIILYSNWSCIYPTGVPLLYLIYPLLVTIAWRIVYLMPVGHLNAQGHLQKVFFSCGSLSYPFHCSLTISNAATLIYGSASFVSWKPVILCGWCPFAQSDGVSALRTNFQCNIAYRLEHTEYSQVSLTQCKYIDNGSMNQRKPEGLSANIKQQRAVS